MATYVLKRVTYASVRNPHEEVLTTGSRQSFNQDIAESHNTEEIGNNQMQEPMEVKTSQAAKNALTRKAKVDTPVYQNLNDRTRIDKANNALHDDDRRLKNRNRTVNQNINITRNTNISNPAKETAAKLDAQVKMARMQQKASEGGGVNAKLIEMQKTNPLKPLSMN